MIKDSEMRNSVILGVVVAGILAISLIAYFMNTNNSEVNIEDESVDISNVSDESGDLESASTEIGKTVEEAQNTVEDTNVDENVSIDADEEDITNVTQEDETDLQVETTNSEVSKDDEQEVNSSEEETEVNFVKPISGTILREFANESLVYSETLKEWITHNGIDISADKTTVVSASADGTVSAIKNDPRYGLTVIINHNNGYQTVYSNLLTAEFVVEGEEVTQGQTIGTVGNSAAFEICDEYHLHFELLKNNEYLDPTIYMSFE